MFTRLIGKRCSGEGCSLNGQLQESALVMCPECGGDLTAVRVPNRPAQAAAALALALIGAGGGFTTYSYVVRALSPIQMVLKLRGLIDVTETIQPRAANDWLVARMRVYNETGPVQDADVQFLYEVKDGRRTTTLRRALAAKSTISVEVLPSGPAVSGIYFVHTDGQRAQVLFGNDRAFTGGTQPILIPEPQQGRGMGIGLAGAAMEHFVLIAAKKPLPALEALQRKSAGAGDQRLPDADVSAAIGQLEHDQDAYVLHLFVPHS